MLWYDSDIDMYIYIYIYISRNAFAVVSIFVIGQNTVHFSNPVEEVRSSIDIDFYDPWLPPRSVINGAAVGAVYG
jgi:hypothetical protein